MSFAFAILLLLGLVVFPISMHKFLMRHKDELNTQKFKHKYASLYSNVQYHKVVALRFTLYFCTRRFIFAMIICFLKDSIVLQVMAADFTILGMLAFYFSIFPMSDRANNFIQIFNEIAIWTCISLLFIFTDYVGSPVDRYNYGQYFLYFIGFNIIINLVIFVLSIYWSIKKSCKRRMLKKKMQS